MERHDQKMGACLSEKAEHALASLALEDITPSKELMEDIIAFDRNEISETEFIQRVVKRVTQSNG